MIDHPRSFKTGVRSRNPHCMTLSSRTLSSLASGGPAAFMSLHLVILLTTTRPTAIAIQSYNRTMQPASRQGNRHDLRTGRVATSLSWRGPVQN